MGTVNYIKGLYGPVRVRWPLAFSPSGKIDPTTGHALSDYAVISGAGYSTTYPETSDLASARFLEWNLKTTNTGSGEVYGDYMSLQSAGTGTGYVYTKGALAKSVTGGYVAELGACYYKTQLTAGTVTGQAYVGFFEYVVDTGVANMPSGGILQLDDIVDGSLNAVHGYIAIRTYGGTPFSNLFNIMDHTSGTGKLFYGSTLKMRIASTSYYIPLSTAENTLTFSGIVSITNTTDASSLTAGALVVAGGIACAKQLYLGDDIDMSVSGTGVYDITLKDSVADALSIVRGTTDMMVFDSTTPKITVTPNLFLAGNLDFSTAASDIVAKANTAVAIEFYDATTKFVEIDTRNTVSASMVAFTCIPSTIVAAANVTRRAVNIVPGTTTLTGSTGVDDMVGVALLVGRPTITDVDAVTVAKASTLCITNAPAAGGSVTITTALALEVVSGASLFGGAVTATGVLTVTNNTAASSAILGAVVVTGGIATSAALWVGTTSKLVGAITADSTLGIAGLITSTNTTGTLAVGTTGAPVTLVTATAGIGLFLTCAANSATYYGQTIEITKTGSASFIGAMSLKATTTNATVAGGLYGLMCTAQNSSTGAQTGANIMEAGEFHCIIDATVTNHQEAYSLCLKMTNNSNANGVAAYLRLRDAGTSRADYFFNAPNWTVGTAADGMELFTTNTDATPSHGLRVFIGGVTYWFLMTDTHA